VAARLARVPVVVHGEHGTLQLKPYQARVQRLAWGRADRLLSVSSRLAERMSVTTGFSRDRISVIRNGVDLSRFGAVARGEARRALGIPGDTFAVGTAGRLVPVKDQAMLVAALGAMAASGIGFVALIAGEGPLKRDLEQQAAAAGIADRVRFLGHRPDIEQVFAALDVFVLSSSSEGLSNTILEAMASGVPVVATRVGGADELVEEGRTGLLVPPGSPEALAEALRDVGANASRRAAFGRAARERAESVFGLARMIGDYRDLYLDLAPRARPTRDAAVA
jgi:glycosyltransferase involved in cell wall biosynthesis